MTIKNLIKNISWKDWLFLIGMAFLVILATTVPYFYGYSKANENTYFLAIPSLNEFDYPNYFSYIEQVRQGHFLFEDYYTTEAQPRVILNLFFLALGLIAKFSHLSAIAIFHLVRVFLIPIFIFVFYLFLKFLFQEKIKQKICLILICFSSGWGFILYSLSSIYKQSMDLWVPEAVTFLSFYTNPLFIFSLTLIVLIFFLMLLSAVNKNYRYAIAAGLVGLILFQIHPYHLPTVFSVLIVFWLIICLREKKINWLFFKYGLIFFFLSLPPVLYYYWLSSSHWLTVHRISQATPAGLTPPFWPFLISYGLLWPLAFVGIYPVVKNKEKYVSVFLPVWLITHIILVYLPFPLQRKLTEGLHLVLCLMATEGIFFIWQKIKEKKIFKFFKNKFLFYVLFLFFFSLSNVFILSKDIFLFSDPGFSLPKKAMEPMLWLKNNSSEDAKVLSVKNLYLHNLIPAFSVRKVFAGHSFETAYYQNKIKEIDWFFNTNINDDEKEKFLKKNGLNYILFYKNGNYSFRPNEKKYLKLVFENELINIYQNQ